MGAMDELIDRGVVGRLAGHLSAAGTDPHALRGAASMLEGLKLRQRVDVVREAMLLDLPDTYDDVATLVRSAFDDPSLSGWMLWPVSEAVVDRALRSGRTAHFDDAMDVLALVTTRFTGEFAIRAMLVADLDRAVGIAESWTGSPDEHVRRLASEGTRSHLPWAKGVPGLVRQARSTRAIVDALHRDDSETVRRSVANHVNDLSRDHPDLAADIVRGWRDAPGDHTPQVSRHALRTLVKKGHRGALDVMGFSGADFSVEGPVVTDAVVRLGESVHFTGRVTNDGADAARVAIDVVVHFQKARGATQPKVFKFGVRTLAPGESVDVSRSYSFHPRTTRAFHLGEHAVALQVNGIAFGHAPFELVGDGTAVPDSR